MELINTEHLKSSQKVIRIKYLFDDFTKSFQGKNWKLNIKIDLLSQ